MMPTRRFPAHLALMGETEDIVDDEGGEDVPKRGQSKHAPEIMRLWAEGASLTRIANQVNASTRAVRRVLLAHGVPEDEIKARLIRRQKVVNHEPVEDPRISDFDPVSEDDEGREEAPAVSWPDAARDIKCETCLHHHVCRWVKVCEQHPWIACRNWRRKEAS